VEDGSVLPFVMSFEGKNDRNFEDNEKTLAELNYFFFKVLYHWTATLDFNLLSFHDFLDLFSLSS
jgi:hypothetical protein